VITRTVTAEQATAPSAAGRGNSRGCAADNAIAAVACQGDGTTVLSRAWDHLEVSASMVGLSVCVN